MLSWARAETPEAYDLGEGAQTLIGDTLGGHHADRLGCLIEGQAKPCSAVKSLVGGVAAGDHDLLKGPLRWPGSDGRVCGVLLGIGQRAKGQAGKRNNGQSGQGQAPARVGKGWHGGFPCDKLKAKDNEND